MRVDGKYKDENEVHQKVKDKMFSSIMKNKHVYFIVGSHYRFPTFMIVGIIYPKKSDLITAEDVATLKKELAPWQEIVMQSWLDLDKKYGPEPARSTRPANKRPHENSVKKK